MVLAEHPKLEFAASYGFNGSEEKIGSRKVSVTDHANGFEYTATSDSFVIDMDSFSNGINQETATNSRNTLQRNLSRKGCQRSIGDVDLSSPKPKGGAVGSAMPEKPAVVAVGGPPDHSSSAQVHHQIIVSANNNNINLRRNSFKRSSTSWLFDPKRILFFFATLSSLGTIILIYFTLSVAKYNPGENGLD